MSTPKQGTFPVAISQFKRWPSFFDERIAELWTIPRFWPVMKAEVRKEATRWWMGNRDKSIYKVKEAWLERINCSVRKRHIGLGEHVHEWDVEVVDSRRKGPECGADTNGLLQRVELSQDLDR